MNLNRDRMNLNRDRDRNDNAWRCALIVVSLAAVFTTAWSLYAVARHYHVPVPVAGVAVGVFDGIAYACLRLASEASAAGRSALGARCCALFMAGVSVALNITHALLIRGGIPAALLFAVPTIGLLAVSELAWAGPRAAARAQHGDRPFRLPALGLMAWLLAPVTAGRAVKEQALEHITRAGRMPGPRPDFRSHLASLDPAEAIRIAHASEPGLSPAELAALLRQYGVAVDAVQVALVVLGRPAEVSVERPDAVRTDPDTVRTTPDTYPSPDPQNELTRADTLSGPRRRSITDVVRQLVRGGITDQSSVVSITRDVLGPNTREDSILRSLRSLKRECEKADPASDEHDGFYL